MRLINADELIKKAYSEAEGMSNSCKDFGTIVEWLVDKMPTVEPEQKKGKWIEKPDPFGFFETIPVCSECGCTTKYREKYTCCPHCGVKMEEEE